MGSSKTINPITERILDELAKQHRSVYELCKACGLHAGSFSNTKHNPNSWKNAAMIVSIGQYLNVSAEYLITGHRSSLESDKIIQDLKVENGKLRKEIKDSKIKISTLVSTISQLLSADEDERVDIHRKIISKL